MEPQIAFDPKKKCVPNIHVKKWKPNADLNFAERNRLTLWYLANLSDFMQKLNCKNVVWNKDFIFYFATQIFYKNKYFWTKKPHSYQLLGRERGPVDILL